MADDDIRATVKLRCVHCGLPITFDYDAGRWLDATGFAECTFVFDGHRP